MRHFHTQAKVAAEADWHTGPSACRPRDAPALLVWWQRGDGSIRQEKGPHTILLCYLHLSSIIISIRQCQCPQGPCLSTEGASYDGYGQKKIPIKLRPHYSIPLTCPRLVFPGWSLTILHHVPCSLKAPGDHKHGMSPSFLLFLFPGLHQEVFIKCQSDK